MKSLILKEIFSCLPAQKKKITTMFEKYPSMERELDLFLNKYDNFMQIEKVTPKQVADAYLEMVGQIMYSRLQFVRTGEYLAKSQIDAYDAVYDNKKFMTRYMLALALSQFLWRHHYLIFSYYKKIIQSLKGKLEVLEVGSGHGLFLLEILENVKSINSVDVVDISKSSVRMTKNIIQSVRPLNYSKVSNNVIFFTNDINDYMTEKKYDFIIMGEIIEHVDEPLKILKSVFNLLNDSGKVFITTCANCPTVDHVYLFKNIEDIRLLIKKTGFNIDSELISPSENKGKEYLIRHKVDISYAAILKK
jgi:2-polyprenyl-3-methyl-5-hydroxy-6-metoxy-1,4-benzoquinol methylase